MLCFSAYVPGLQFCFRFSSVQFSRSVVSDSLWPHGLQHARLHCPSSAPRGYSKTHVHWVGDAIQPSHPLSSPSSPTFNLSQHQGIFQWVSSSHQLTKYLSFSFSSSPSNEYSGLISFTIDWFDLLAALSYSNIAFKALGEFGLMSLALIINSFNSIFWVVLSI